MTCSPKVNVKVRVLNVDTGITLELVIGGKSGAYAKVAMVTSGDGAVLCWGFKSMGGDLA
jgi:hypothetical protein